MAAKVKPTVQVGSRDVDLRKALPLTLGDLDDLKEKHDVIVDELSSFAKEPRKGIAFLGYVLRKAEPTITDEEIRGLSLTDVAAISRIIATSDTLDPKGSST